MTSPASHFLKDRLLKKRRGRRTLGVLTCLTLFPAALSQTTAQQPSQTLDPTIIGVAAESPDFSTLLSALELAGLTGELQGPGPFTLFAPTNSAFAALSEAELNALLADREALQNILSYHVVPGRYTTSDITAEISALDTLEGSELSITQQGVGSATVTAVNIEASNGVIFAIDSVLTPPDAAAAAEVPTGMDAAPLYSSSADLSVRYPLDEVGGSGVSGSVLVAAYGSADGSDGTIVTVSLSGTPSDTAVGGDYPAVLVAGSCDAARSSDPLAALNSVPGSSGFSTTTLELSFEQITGGDQALVVFLAPNDDTIVSCGEVGG